VSLAAIGADHSFASVQERIAQLDALLTGGTTTTSASSTSSTTTTSSAAFAAELAAAGLDSTGSTASSLASAASAAAASSGAGSTTSATGGQTAQSLIAAAEKYVGTPYVWGGESLSEGGLDCSGLVLRSLEDIGVTGIPRTAHEQMHLGTAVASLDQAKPGDLLVFNGGTHIGIYVGGGKMIDSPHPGGHVSVRDVYATPTAIRRILPQAGAATSTAASGVDATRRAALGLLSTTGAAS